MTLEDWENQIFGNMCELPSAHHREGGSQGRVRGLGTQQEVQTQHCTGRSYCRKRNTPSKQCKPCLPRHGTSSPVSPPNHSLLQMSQSSFPWLSEAIFRLTWKSCPARLPKPYFRSNNFFRTLLGSVWHHRCWHLNQIWVLQGVYSSAISD